MTVERNVEGLRGNAQRKRQEAFDKVEQGIQKLIKEQKVINFNTVAKASGLSKAWLYKEPEIKARIEHLRRTHSSLEKVPPKQRSSDASKDAIIKTLKERIKIESFQQESVAQSVDKNVAGERFDPVDKLNEFVALLDQVDKAEQELRAFLGAKAESLIVRLKSRNS